MPDPLPKLESTRAALLQKLAETGDMRRGSISEAFRSCGKPTCACAQPDHPGHGPYYAHTLKIDGKTRTRQLRPGPALTKLEREVETYRAFRAACEQLVDVNESICDMRPVESAGEREKKRRSPRSSKPKSSPKLKR